LPFSDSKTKFNATEDFFLVEFSKAATDLTSLACLGEFPRETPVMAGRLELASLGGVLALFRHRLSLPSQTAIPAGAGVTVPPEGVEGGMMPM
jgi:hypothetical protein